MTAKSYLVVPLAGAALIAAGCGSSSSSSSAAKPSAAKPTVAATPAPSGSGAMMSADTGAKISLLSPGGGTVIHGNAIPVDVQLTHFKVACQFAGTANQMGVGHYHIELDGSLINMFCSPRAAVSLQNIKPGAHTLTVLAAENDHTDDMKSAQKVSFTYQPAKALPAITGAQLGAPSITILSPKPGSSVHGGFAMTVQPKNFRFSCALYGKPDVAGYGHWHINVDSTSKGMMGMGTMLGMSCARTFHVSLAGIKPGHHTFYAILEDDQHAPTPHAQASVTVNVS
jgi:hypothetical protein